MYTYQQVMNDVVIPEITETLFKKDWEWLRGMFSEMPSSWVGGGSQIEKRICVAETDTARNYDRTDVNPESGTATFLTAKWNKIYSDTAFEVHGIDMNEAKFGGVTEIADILQDASNRAYRNLKNRLFANLYTMLKADIDSAAAYSDAAISRSTYPRLASYEENTDTAITLAIARAARNAVTLDEAVTEQEYLWIMQQAVMNVFRPLAAAELTWNTTGVKGQEYAAGYQPVGSFDGTDVQSIPGMTTGDVFILRPQDVYISNHMALEAEMVPSGKHSLKGVMRIGVNLIVDNPGYQGKLTDKD
jgi:hypothetical protein